MHPPRRPPRFRNRRKSGGHLERASFWNVQFVSSRRNVAQQCRIQLPDFGHGTFGHIRHQRHVSGNRQLGGFVFERLVEFQIFDPIVFRILGHDRHRQNDRDVIGGFLRNGIAAAKLPEVRVAGSLNRFLDIPRPTVVGGNRQVPISEPMVQVTEMTGCRARCLLRIQAVVDKRRLIQSVLATAPLHKLPHSGGGFV